MKYNNKVPQRQHLRQRSRQPRRLNGAPSFVSDVPEEAMLSQRRCSSKFVLLAHAQQPHHSQHRRVQQARVIAGGGEGMDVNTRATVEALLQRGGAVGGGVMNKILLGAGDVQILPS